MLCAGNEVIGFVIHILWKKNYFRKMMCFKIHVPNFTHSGLSCWKYSSDVSKNVNKVLKLDTELNRIWECMELLVGVLEDF